MLLQRVLANVSNGAANRSRMDEWLSALIAEVDRDPIETAGPVRALGDLLEREPHLRMLSSAMFDEQPPERADRTALSPTARVRDVPHLMLLLERLLVRAPAYDPNGLVGLLPFYTVLNWFLCTPSGARLFADPRVNSLLKPILDLWGDFLRSGTSRHVLDDREGGWFSAAALREMDGFDEQFACDPSAPHRGFGSWDDFFTRRFRPGARPVAAPADPSVIVNACESAPYRIQEGVRADDTFWLKGHPYSLRHMLASEELASRFAGGTVYQGLLGATNYHRWHSPVSGRVVSARVEPGLYYWIEPTPSLTMEGILECQTYLAQMATRAVLAIEADEPAIGLLCVVAIGLMDCSTCEPTVAAGDRLAKGDEIGMFHFGGSTHCLVFRPGLKLDFDLHGETPGPTAGTIRVNAAIARIT